MLDLGLWFELGLTPVSETLLRREGADSPRVSGNCDGMGGMEADEWTGTGTGSEGECA
jgi:hypothetical protein